MRWVAAGIVVTALWGQSPAPGRNAFLLRGQRQDVYYLPAAGTKESLSRVLFFTGDGGWRGAAPDFGGAIASWGYEVFGVDTKRYLESFTDGRTTLKVTDVEADLRTLAAWISPAGRGRVHLVGWSEGAGLGLLGVAANDSSRVFTGLVALGLPEVAILGWRAADSITWITKRLPNEPSFRPIDYLGQTAAPLVMIHSTGDEYTTVEAARKLFAAAREPKRFVLVRARNHRYDGGRDEFFRALREGLGWLEKAAK